MAGRHVCAPMFGEVLPFAPVATGSIAGHTMQESRINELIHTVREEITPGPSALFVMSSDAAVDRVHEAFEGQPIELVGTNLSSKQGPSSAARSATELDGLTRTSSLVRPPGLRFRGELTRER
jgi:uncharacterized membrane protein